MKISGDTDAKTVNKQHETVFHLVDESIKKNQTRIAIEFNDVSVTYSELGDRVNQTVWYLQKIGIRPGELVGIYLDKKVETIILILGLLKMGAAYLPLDPGHPMSRTEYIIQDSGVSYVFSEEKYLSNLNATINIKLINMDVDWDLLSQMDTMDTEIVGSSKDLTYIIYTSGSTGKPKGVEIMNQSVVNLLVSMQESPGISSSDRLLSVTTLTFDISVLEIFLPLITGSTLVIADYKTARDGSKLKDFLTSRNISIMQATPSTWKVLVDIGWEGDRKLKVLCGGEALSKKLAGELLPKCASLWNMYGPTETTIWSTCMKIGQDLRIGLGEPILNTQIYILDENLEVVDHGTTGILYIGGLGLAKGYLNNRELTDSKFIQNPFGNGRLYNTGDLVRWVDGILEYVGRIDSQVKVRGFRIELGEIEHVAELIPNVKQAITIVKEDKTGVGSLYLYYTSVDENMTDNLLKETLAEHLPYYMIPSYFIHVDQFPLTPNNKIDRNALKQLDFKLTREGKVKEGIGNTELELELIGIWNEYLMIDDIQLDDEFLDLGGHSLIATLIISKINKTYNTQITLMDFLVNGSTIRQLVELILSRINC